MSNFSRGHAVRAAFLSLAFSVAAPAFAGEVAHDLGTTIVPDAPERIVALEFSFVDSLVAVGVAPVGIADDNHRDRIVPAYTGVIGDEWVSVGTRKTPSLEVIASLQPDLIIADKNRHSAIYETLSEIAPTVVFDSLAGAYETSLEIAETIGKTVGKEAEILARLEEHHATMAAFKDELGDVSGQAIQFYVETADGLWLHSPVSYNGSLLAWFGFESNMPKTNSDSYGDAVVGTSLEQLSEIDPAIILRAAYADPGVTAGWVGQPLYDNLQAVQNETIYDVDPHRWARLRGLVASEVSAASLVELLADHDH